MSETTVPAAEAEGVVDAAEVASYELAFHVLPTVAEGEVSKVVDAIKTSVTEIGGTITDEEAAERFDLAYEIVKQIEGKNRKFASAYFGWVRFSATPESVEELDARVSAQSEILRHLLIRLTRVEEEHPFRFHEALAAQKMVTTVGESEVVPDTTTVAPKETATEEADSKETAEPAGEVNEAEIDEALKKDEA